MAIVAQTDGIQLGAQKEMTRYTIAVAGGTLHVVALRNSEGSQKSITTAFVASGLFQSPSKFVTINVAINYSIFLVIQTFSSVEG